MHDGKNDRLPFDTRRSRSEQPRHRPGVEDELCRIGERMKSRGQFVERGDGRRGSDCQRRYSFI